MVITQIELLLKLENKMQTQASIPDKLAIGIVSQIKPIITNKNWFQTTRNSYKVRMNNLQIIKISRKIS
jgi:hypothetical protein